MKTKKNPPKCHLGPFPFKDGTQILDIRYDPVFKAVFTRDTVQSRGALSALISALIGKKAAVEAITANEPASDDSRQRHLRFDVNCRTERGELINVEMTFNPNPREPVRLEYYTARLFTGQDLHGTDKEYGILKETYQITIIAKRKFFQDNNFCHRFLYYDPENRVSLGGKTRIITVELVKTKPIADKPVKDMTNAELWAVFFQYLTDLGKRPKITEIINHEEGIAMAVATLGAFTQSEIEYMRETSRLKAELDWKTLVAYNKKRLANAKKRAEKRGLAEGLAEGQAKGLAEGLAKGMVEGQARGLVEGQAKGLAEGREEGRSNASLDIARNLKSIGLSASQIASVTGLSPETIDGL
jgi:predicted transposase/invertase (TIGR01784 family)